MTSGVTFGTSSAIRQNVFTRRLRLLSTDASSRLRISPGMVERAKIEKVFRIAFQNRGSSSITW